LLANWFSCPSKVIEGGVGKKTYFFWVPFLFAVIAFGISGCRGLSPYQGLDSLFYGSGKQCNQMITIEDK
jgi:hypothetical protein